MNKVIRFNGNMINGEYIKTEIVVDESYYGKDNIIIYRIINVEDFENKVNKYLKNHGFDIDKYKEPPITNNAKLYEKLSDKLINGNINDGGVFYNKKTDELEVSLNNFNLNEG